MARSKSSGRKRKSTAARSQTTATAAPAWYWLGGGLALGLFLAFLYYLATIPQAPPGTAPANPATRAATGEGLKFSFFTQLPQRGAEQPAPASPPPRASQAPAQPSVKAASARPDRQFYLQAGSFRQREQAEKRRVQLLLLDTEASIVSVERDGQSWYRVQAGPFDSSSQVASIRGKLSREGIDSLTTTRPGD